MQGNPPFPLPAGIPYERGPYGDTTWKTATLQFGPRLGFAYNLNSKTVIRPGFGIYYPHDIGNVAFDVTRNQPFTERINSTSNALIPNATWSAPFPDDRHLHQCPVLGMGRSSARTLRNGLSTSSVR